MNFGELYKILVLSYFNIRNLRNADIVGAGTNVGNVPQM